MNDIKPLEETDPLIAELFMDVANKRYDNFNVKRIVSIEEYIIFMPYKNYHIGGRNELCQKTNIKNKKCTCMDVFSYKI